MLPTVVLLAHIGGTNSFQRRDTRNMLRRTALPPSATQTHRPMPFQMRLSVQALAIAGIVLSASAEAQSTSSAVAITRPGFGVSTQRDLSMLPRNPDGQHVLVVDRLTVSRDFEWPAPLRDPHDGNYARTGAIVGALATGVASAIIVGLFAKRDCDPGLCGSEFQRGALVGGGVGLAAGGVLGWLIGAEIARPAPATPPQ